jgi:hypothetical protein
LWLSLSVVRAEQNVVVLLDDSGSMQEEMGRGSMRKIDAAKEALLTVLEQVSDDANVGVLLLNGPSGNGDWLIKLGPLDRAQLEDAVRRIESEHGTPLGQFMKIAADELLSWREKHRYGTYRLLIVTDGEANDQDLVEQYLPHILARGITVDVIGVDMQTDHSLATRVDSYRRADDPRSLTQALQEALAETAVQDDGSALDEDYQLLQGIPDEVASAMIAALTTNNNSPIGESPDDNETAEADRESPLKQWNRPPLGVLFVVLFVVLAVLSKVIGRHRL